MVQDQKVLIVSVGVDHFDRILHPAGQFPRLGNESERNVGPNVVHSRSLLGRFIKDLDVTLRLDLILPLAARETPEEAFLEACDAALSNAWAFNMSPFSFQERT